MGPSGLWGRTRKFARKPKSSSLGMLQPRFEGGKKPKNPLKSTIFWSFFGLLFNHSRCFARYIFPGAVRLSRAGPKFISTIYFKPPGGFVARMELLAGKKVLRIERSPRSTGTIHCLPRMCVCVCVCDGINSSIAWFAGHPFACGLPPTQQHCPQERAAHTQHA